MGNTIKEVAESEGDIEVAVTFDPNGGDYSSISYYEGNGIDLYVDFTHPDAVVENVREAARKGINTVIGTTGWYDKLKEVEEIARENNVRVLYASNFSVGTNLLFAAVDYLSKKLPDGWDVAVDEKHHTGKADAPSGTGKTLGKILVENIQGKEEQTHVREKKRSDEKVDVIGVRVGSVAGEHEVNFVPEDSYDERLQLTHNSFSTRAFAQGAITAAKWLHKNQDLEPSLYNFKEDVLEL